ncbi:MAG: family 2 glycosyl transferase [Chitinophagaceae bacterium BSSC1]|nr:MAG: family 2 glycosyl transferase [Chitinophagaceae bacterium BSSC1]
MQVPTRVPEFPPSIAAISDQAPRPKWSVMIPVYNCKEYLAQTLQSVIDQDLGPNLMQIEVVDDCSTDADIQQMVASIGKGRIAYFRQPVNLGNVRNFETCINRSRGELLHLLHGDDFVKPGFYKKMQNLMEENPEAGAGCSDWEYITSSGGSLWNKPMIDQQKGILDNWLERIATQQLLQTPSVVVRRSTYETLGSFYAVKSTEDWVMWVRIAAHYPFAYLPEKLACYRVHSMNVTSNSFSTGDNYRDLQKTIALNMQYLPIADRKRVEKACRKNLSFYYSNLAHKQFHDHQSTKTVLKIGWDALKFDLNFFATKLLAKLYLKILVGYKQ